MNKTFDQHKLDKRRDHQKRKALFAALMVQLASAPNSIAMIDRFSHKTSPIFFPRRKKFKHSGTSR